MEGCQLRRQEARSRGAATDDPSRQSVTYAKPYPTA